MCNQVTFALPELPPGNGCPVLQWEGKRPFRQALFAPAQLLEQYGQARAGWSDSLYYGDNLQVLGHLLPDYRGNVDLIYIDPPFDSNAEYGKTISLRGTFPAGIRAVREKQYSDRWPEGQYLQFMYERLILLRELLSDTGSIYLHCDWHQGHLLRSVMDEVFGRENFINEIIWYYRRWTAASRSFQKMHDTIFLYAKTGNYTLHPVYVDATPGQQRKHCRGYDRNSVRIHGQRRPQLLVYNKQKVDAAVEKGTIDLSEYARIVPVRQAGTIAHDVWEINYLNSQAAERLDYPTQKPEALLERIISASSSPGDLVLDCFMGSGTTLSVSRRLGRRFIGADSNPGAVHTAVKRLAASSGTELPGLNVYGVPSAPPATELKADITRKGDRLEIRALESPGLPEKFGLERNGVTDWRWLADSVMIDWDYDGQVLRPTLLDFPEKKDMVRGVYTIPENAGQIRVKITDLLDRSTETDVT